MSACVTELEDIVDSSFISNPARLPTRIAFLTILPVAITTSNSALAFSATPSNISMLLLVNVSLSNLALVLLSINIPIPPMLLSNETSPNVIPTPPTGLFFKYIKRSSEPTILLLNVTLS